jgi:hypothetical protein
MAVVLREEPDVHVTTVDRFSMIARRERYDETSFEREEEMAP